MKEATANSEPMAPTVERMIIDVLSRYCGERGESEGALQTLERIIRERDILLRRAIKRDLLAH